MYLDEIIGTWVPCPFFFHPPAGVSRPIGTEQRQAMAELMGEKLASIRAEERKARAPFQMKEEPLNARDPKSFGFIVVS